MNWLLSFLFSAAVAAVFGFLSVAAADDTAKVQAAFANPPEEARAWCYWRRIELSKRGLKPAASSYRGIS